MAVSDALGMGDAVRYANELSEKQYPGENLNQRGDALRHLLWQGALQQQYGDIPAAAVGWAHELGDADAAEKEMDTFNNELGRQLGSEAATKEELLQHAIDAINQGKAKTIE